MSNIIPLAINLNNLRYKSLMLEKLWIKFTVWLVQGGSIRMTLKVVGILALLIIFFKLKISVRRNHIV